MEELRISTNNLTEFVYRDISKSKTPNRPIRKTKDLLPPSYEEISEKS